MIKFSELIDILFTDELVKIEESGNEIFVGKLDKLEVFTYLNIKDFNVRKVYSPRTFMSDYSNYMIIELIRKED